jgi:DNA polymerase-1
VTDAARSKRLYLVDGSGILFRAFHALPPLTTRSGLPTGAAYGFTSMLVKLLRESAGTHVAVALDAPGRTFRDDAYEHYKATRAETPADLIAQIPLVRRVVEALGLPLLVIEGVEADDVIGTLARQALERGFEVVVVTSDKDMMQLVGAHLTLLDTMHDRRSGVAQVRDRFGVTPDRVVDVMALMGDAVDNIPGVRGIGEKTACRLVSHFGSIDELYRRLDEVPTLDLRGAQRIRQLLADGEDMARSSRFLATIRTDVDLPLGIDDLRRTDPDPVKLRRLSEELEFDRILRGFFAAGGGTPREIPTERVAADVLEHRMADAPVLALAFAAPGLLGSAGGVAVATGPAAPVLLCAEIPGAVAELLAGPGSRGRPVFVEDLKEHLHRLGRDRDLGPPDAGVGVVDVALASYVLDPSRRDHSIDALVRDRLGRELPPAEGGDPDARAAAVAASLLQLGPVLHDELPGAGATSLYRDVEMPLARVLAVVEARGILVDRTVLERVGAEFRAAADTLEKEIHELAGGPFNISSNPQLRDVLFERLKLPTKGVRKGRTGLSVDADVLARLAESHPIAARVVEHRALQKLISTYANGLLAAVDARTGRLHTRFHQTVAATGRLSSSEPNLQNIPIRTAEGRRIREAFVAAPGMVLLAGDYSQIELRVLAHLSEDPVLVEAFRSGEDVHRRTAAEVFGVASEAVSTEQRRRAKVINFGVLYGMGPQRLSRELGIPISEAEDYIRRYFERYAKVREYSERVVEAGRREGFVSTMIGRRRFLPELGSRVPNIRQAAERMAWNSPIQGTAADIIKLAMLALERELETSGGPARILLQVHDELLLEVPRETLEATRPVLRRAMESVVDLAVPLVVDLKAGPNWAEMQ